MKAIGRRLGFVVVALLGLIPAGTRVGRTAHQVVNPTAGGQVTEEAAVVNPQVREYFAANGRRVQISVLGSLLDWENPKDYFPLERQCDVFAYRVPSSKKARVVSVCGGQVSTTQGKPDLTLVSFKGPANGTQFAVWQEMTTTTRLRTSDKLLDFTIVNRCKIGTGEFIHTTTARNRSEGVIALVSTKHIWHVVPSEGNIVNLDRAGDSHFAWDPCPFCDCPNCPDAIPRIGGHTAVMRGAGALPRLILAGDATPLGTDVCGPTLAVPVRQLNVESLFCWRTPVQLQNLAPGGSDTPRESFTSLR